MIFIILLYASYTDIKKRTISDLVPILIIACSFLLDNFYLKEAILFYIITLVIAVVLEHLFNMFLIGGGDLKLISSLVLALGFYDTLYVISLMAIPVFISIIYCKLILKRKLNYIPLAPYITIGYFLYLLGGIYV